MPVLCFGYVMKTVSSSFSTCFYVLGLLASTSIGADKLEELGWDCVRHKGSDIWPIIEHEVTYYVEPEFSEDEEVNLRRSAYAHNSIRNFRTASAWKTRIFYMNKTSVKYMFQVSKYKCRIDVRIAFRHHSLYTGRK